MRKSKVLARLRADKPVLMTNISMGVNTMAVEMAGLLGFHAVWLDMEHRSFTWRETEMLVMAARLGDLDALVRIRKQEGYVTFQRPLQEGAAGLMVPHVRSPETAAAPEGAVERGAFGAPSAYALESGARAPMRGHLPRDARSR